MTDDVAGPGNGPLPIREVPLTAPLRWLALGWHDFTRAFGPSLFHGFIVMAAGMVIATLALRFWPILPGAFSGFVLIAPILATGPALQQLPAEVAQP